MSGGSKDKKKTTTTNSPVSTKAVYGGMPEVTTVQPHFPGMIEAITSQLMKGFGTAPSFNDLYRPMQIPNFKEPVSSTQAALTKKGANFAAPNTGIAALDAILKLAPTTDKDKK